MPSIPAPLLQESIPSRSGIARTAQQAPAMQSPMGSVGTAQAVGNAFAGLGGALAQAGEYEQQRQDLLARKQAADDLIAGKLTSLKVVPGIQRLYGAEAQDPDYSTFEKRFYEKGNALIAEGAQGLNPRAARQYEMSAREALNALQARAVGEEGKRRDEAALYVEEQTVAQAQQRMLDAQTPFERIVARTDMERTMSEMVGAGLARGGPAAERLRKAMEAVSIQDVQYANRVNPEAMVLHLKALMDNKPGTEGLPVPPASALAALSDEAERELHDAQLTVHRGDIQADKDVKKAQDQAENLLTNELYAEMQKERPDPQALATIQRKIMAAGVASAPGKATLVSDEGYRRLLHASQTFLAAVTREKPLQDDPSTLMALERGLLTPTPLYPWPTVDDIATAVTRGDIKPETGARMMKDRVKQLDEAHPSKIAEVQQGKKRLRDGLTQVIGSSDLFNAGENILRGPQMRRFLEADKLFDDTMQALQDSKSTPQEKIDVVRQFAPAVAEELTQRYALYFEAYEKSTIPKLPPGLETVWAKEGITRAFQELEAMRGTMSPPMYNEASKNLIRRQELKYVGGEPVKAVEKIPDPQDGWGEWLKNLFSGGGSKPIIP